MTQLYQTLAADPPWPEHGGGTRGAQDHYETVPVTEIPNLIRKGLMASPLGHIHPTGCHFWLWTMGRYLVSGEAAYVCQRIGARPVKVFPWLKTRGGVDDIGTLSEADLVMSLGQYGRSAHEYLMLAVFGSLPQLHTGRSEPDVIVAPVPRGDNGVRIHSRKPVEAYRKIERISPGPRLELFARSPRHGWDVWGNQIDKFEPQVAAEASSLGGRG